jgi:hypothetical protein
MCLFLDGRENSFCLRYMLSFYTTNNDMHCLQIAFINQKKYIKDFQVALRKRAVLNSVS